MLERRRARPEQIVAKPREHERMPPQGLSIPRACSGITPCPTGRGAAWSARVSDTFRTLQIRQARPKKPRLDHRVGSNCLICRVRYWNGPA